MAEPATRIYDLALQCEQGLEKLQALFASRNDDGYSRLLHRHRERFQHWAGYLGVFAVPEASLDRRLEKSSQTREIVVRLLGTLERNIQHALGVDSTVADESSRADTSASAKVELKDDAPSTLLPATQAALEGIRHTIDWLHHLGLAIRETSKSTIRARVKRFTDKRAEESARLEHLTLLIVRGLYPHITDSFADQLAESVSFRRRRLEYQARHGRILDRRQDPEQKPQEGTVKPGQSEIGSKAEPLQSVLTATQSQKIQGQDLSDGKRPSNYRQAGPASVTEHSGYKEPDQPLLHMESLRNQSGPRTATSMNPSNLYPAAPKIPKTEACYKCVWCSKSIHVSEDPNKWRLDWRAHFDEDLRPYVCISEECSAEPVDFCSRRSWYTHMNEHAMDWAQEIHKKAIWYCDLNSHGYEEFMDAKELRDHLKREHEAIVTSEETETLVVRNKMYVSRGPTECPLCSGDILDLSNETKTGSQGRHDQPDCDEVDEANLVAEASSAVAEHDQELPNRVKMMIHVGRHLKSLAFASLRYFNDEDEIEGGSAKSHKGAFSAGIEKRSSQDQNGDHYFELEGSLNFDDPPEQGGLVSRSVSATTKPPDLYHEIRKLQKCPDGTDADFIPEHSLRKLFQKPETQLGAHLRNLESLGDTDRIDELVTFICERAPKAFATLVFSEREHLIICLLENDLDDTLLPVVKNKHGKLYSFPADARVRLADMAVMLANEEVSIVKDVDPRTKKIKEKARDEASDRAVEARAAAIVAAGKVAATFESWPARMRDQFCEIFQWPFLAPVFDGAQFYNMFAEKAVMPFWPSAHQVKHGPFSSVEKWQVHRAHLPRDVMPSGGSGGHPWVAVKILKRDRFATTDEFKQAVRLEAKVLNVMSSLKHDHLIRAIACYSKGQSDCFIFPWADHGNLRDYWGQSIMATSPKKRLAPGYMKWVFRQLHGLADAITQLHGRMIRHGDLKPENILCFRNDANKQPEGSCKLVIADAGVAKINYQITQLRTELSLGPKGGTLMYEPPEAEVGSGAPMSRRYDVWSMGCICLEFLVWLVDGREGLKDLTADLNQVGRFYEPHWSKTQRRITGAGRQQEVDDRIHMLHAHPFCQGKRNPLGRLVELIDKKLLVHSLGKPIHLPLLSSSAPQIDSDEVLAGYRSISRSNRLETADDIFDVPPGSRVKSDAMLAELDAILADEESFRLPSSSPDSSAASSPLVTRPHRQFGQHLGVPGAKRAMSSGPSARDYRFELDDSWKYDADTDFPADKIDWGADIKPSTAISDLCSRCSGLRLWALTCSFSDTLDGLAEKALACALCRLLHQHMAVCSKKGDEIVYFFRSNSYITWDKERGQPLVYLCTFPGALSLARHEIRTGLPKLPEAGSPTHIQILSGWISACDKSHQCLPQDIDFVPTRLLDVGGEGSPSIRLIENRPGDGEPRRYLALSHRWGPPELHKTFTTTTTSVTQFKQDIRVSKLPQTFNDAVQVTRKLGERYLWIDSLCIVQDDPKDWEAESKLMEQVYSSAYVTISASCSSGTNDGFLKPRPGRSCVTAKALDDGGALYYLCDAIDDFHLDVEEGELSKRAWVLQERALSRRTIYFSERQSYWECGEGVRCETLTKMNNQRASFLGDADFPHSIDSFDKGMKIDLYQGLYERFSNLQITFPADRPVAIKGLETRLMRTFATTGGFGVFDIYLHRCLLWQRSSGPLKRIAVFHGPTVPSWSWMAYTGGIRYLKVPYGSALWESDVVSPFSDDVDARGSGERDANAKIPGIKAVAWGLASDMAVLGAGGERGAGRVILDDPDSEETRVGHLDALKCVVVGRSKQRLGEQLHYVLIIAAVTTPDGSARVWERIGVGVLTRADISLEGPAIDVLIQ